MRTYTLHVPENAEAGDPLALERAEFVKDDFSWGAFVFNVWWFLYHRLWLAAFLVFVGVVSLMVLLQTLKVGTGASLLAYLLLSLLIGLEAGSLRRWSLARRGKPAVDVLTARDREQAETRGFGRWLSRRAHAAAPVRETASTRRTPATDPVLGLFPDTERRP